MQVGDRLTLGHMHLQVTVHMFHWSIASDKASVASAHCRNFLLDPLLVLEDMQCNIVYSTGKHQLVGRLLIGYTTPNRDKFNSMHDQDFR